MSRYIFFAYYSIQVILVKDEIYFLCSLLLNILNMLVLEFTRISKILLFFAAISFAKSMYPCLPTGIVVTNDGNAILRELDLAHPAAKA